MKLGVLSTRRISLKSRGTLKIQDSRKLLSRFAPPRRESSPLVALTPPIIREVTHADNLGLCRGSRKADHSVL